MTRTQLEAEVRSLRRRLAGRTTEVLVLLEQIEAMKAALDAAGLEFVYETQRSVDSASAEPGIDA